MLIFDWLGLGLGLGVGVGLTGGKREESGFFILACLGLGVGIAIS